MYYYRIYMGNDRKFYWQLTNGVDIIATGHQGFPTRAKCVAQIELVQRVCSSAPIRS